MKTNDMHITLNLKWSFRNPEGREEARKKEANENVKIETRRIYQNVNCVTTAMTSNFWFLVWMLFHIIIMNSDFTASH